MLTLLMLTCIQMSDIVLKKYHFQKAIPMYIQTFYTAVSNFTYLFTPNHWTLQPFAIMAMLDSLYTHLYLLANFKQKRSPTITV